MPDLAERIASLDCFQFRNLSFQIYLRLSVVREHFHDAEDSNATTKPDSIHDSDVDARKQRVSCLDSKSVEEGERSECGKAKFPKQPQQEVVGVSVYPVDKPKTVLGSRQHTATMCTATLPDSRTQCEPNIRAKQGHQCGNDERHKDAPDVRVPCHAAILPLMGFVHRPVSFNRSLLASFIQHSDRLPFDTSVIATHSPAFVARESPR